MRWTTINEGSIGDRLSWDEGFMSDAIRTSRRSSCFYVRSGSIIVYDKRTIGTGYNGAPPDVPSCLELGHCYKEIKSKKSYEDTMNSGLCQGVHSEMNAIFNLTSNPPLKSSSLYTTIFPCNTCAKNLISKRIFNKIIFKRLYDERELEQTLRLFDEAEIEIFQLNLSPERYIDIIFNSKGVKFDVWSSEERERLEKKILR